MKCIFTQNKVPPSAIPINKVKLNIITKYNIGISAVSTVSLVEDTCLDAGKVELKFSLICSLRLSI